MKKEEKTRLSREKIIDAAVLLFGEKGYDGFSVNNLCNLNAVSKGLFYHNFSGKDELFVACVEKTYADLLTFLKNNLEIVDIEGYLGTRLKFFKLNPSYKRIFFESLINVSDHIYPKLKVIRKPFEDFNRDIYISLISNLKLREGVDKVEAVNYFDLMQKMFNAYYSGPAYNDGNLDLLEKDYEKNMAKLLEFMLYGIVDVK